MYIKESIGEETKTPSTFSPPPKKCTPHNASVCHFCKLQCNYNVISSSLPWFDIKFSPDTSQLILSIKNFTTLCAQGYWVCTIPSVPFALRCARGFLSNAEAQFFRTHSEKFCSSKYFGRKSTKIYY